MSSAEFNNTYFVMRHGLSKPNVDNLIVSQTVNGIKEEFGLVPGGVEQAQESAWASYLPSDIVIVTSPFSRTKQTAEVLEEIVGADEFIVDHRIRERGFGEMELQSSENYHDVWARDARSATHRYRGVESLCSVAERELGLMAELERKFARKTIVLVGHADPLNILKAALDGEPLRTHRKSYSIQNAEIQRLPIAPSR